MNKYYKIGGAVALSALISLGVFVLSYNYFPISLFDEKGLFGATITTINAGDTLKDSRSVINTNFSNLNSSKIETSTTTLPLITTLANLSTIGTIVSGIWNGSIINTIYGGTGWSYITPGAILYGNGTSSLATTSAGVSGQVLSLNASGTPYWSSASFDTTQNYTLSGNNTFTGSTTFSSSTVMVSTLTNNGAVTNNSNLTVAGTTTFNGPIVGQYFRATASDSLRASADTYKTANATTWTKAKSIYVYVAGKIRTKFDLTGLGNTSYGQIQIARGTTTFTYGTLRNVTATTTYTEDFYVGAGDSVELWYRNDNANPAVTNFRLYYDFATGTSEVITN